MGRRRRHQFDTFQIHDAKCRAQLLFCRRSFSGNRFTIRLLSGGLEFGRAKDSGTTAGHGSELTAIALSSDGRHAATTSWDATVKLWDVAKQQELASVGGAMNGFSRAAFSPDDTRVVAIALGGMEQGTTRAKVIDVKTGQEVVAFKLEEGPCQDIALLPGGDTIATVVMSGHPRFSRGRAAWGQSIVMCFFIGFGRSRPFQ
ncbi:MAG: hypothetical protein EXS36_06645 [Pedosphaera sp.]|nr:hypothetical protein [Pedosphaera sp.]